MYEYRIVVIGADSPPLVESSLNKLGVEGWKFQSQIDFKDGKGLLFSRFIDVQPNLPVYVPPKTFQETIVQLARKEW